MLKAFLKVVLCAGICMALPSLGVAEDTKEVEAGPLKLQVPGTWKQNEPSSSLRLAEFEIPAVEGDAEPGELSAFGPFGGTVEANVSRWIGQFDAEGRTVKMSQGSGTQGKYVFVDIKGTFKKPVGPPVQGRTQPTPGYQMSAVMVIIEGQGNFFLKLTGPEKTVAAAGADFRKSIGGDAEKEEPYAQ